MAVYTLSGVFVAIGGLLYYADVKNGNPSDGQGKELEIIAAVVLGAGSYGDGGQSDERHIARSLPQLRTTHSSPIPKYFPFISSLMIEYCRGCGGSIKARFSRWFFQMISRKTKTS